MKVYLVRHGKAKKSAPGGDSKRPLNKTGRDEVSRMASFLGRSIRVPRIVHSGLIRATQTAMILADILGQGQMVEESTIPIGPMDDVATFAKVLNTIEDDVMVVGHNPFMGDLVSYLTTGDEEADVCYFETGAVACLEKNGDEWELQWLAGPKLLGMKGIDQGDDKGTN